MLKYIMYEGELFAHLLRDKPYDLFILNFRSLLDVLSYLDYFESLWGGILVHLGEQFIQCKSQIVTL